MGNSMDCKRSNEAIMAGRQRPLPEHIDGAKLDGISANQQAAAALKKRNAAQAYGRARR